jgi:hypothetical protein
MATVQDIRDQVGTRLREIEAEIASLEEERSALAKVADTLGGRGTSSPARNGRRRSTRRSPATGRTSTRANRAGASRSARKPATRRSSGDGGGRAEQTVQIITRRPGITVKEIAAEMGIKPNYLYRVLPTLEKDGKIAKQGTGYVPTARDGAS